MREVLSSFKLSLIVSCKPIDGVDAVEELDTGSAAAVPDVLLGGGAVELFNDNRATDPRCLRRMSNGMARTMLVPMN